jgi:CRP-like cAMP-binding protein
MYFARLRNLSMRPLHDLLCEGIECKFGIAVWQRTQDLPSLIGVCLGELSRALHARRAADELTSLWRTWINNSQMSDGQMLTNSTSPG